MGQQQARTKAGDIEKPQPWRSNAQHQAGSQLPASGELLEH